MQKMDCEGIGATVASAFYNMIRETWLYISMAGREFQSITRRVRQNKNDEAGS